MKANAVSIGVILSSVLTGVFSPVSIQAAELSVPSCNALVSISNDLYLIGPGGKVLTRFTEDGAAKKFVSVSPDGDKVAFAASETANSFTVVNKFGQQGVFNLNLGNNSYLMGLVWSSDDVVRVTKFWGKDYAEFDFRRIPDDMSPPALAVAKPAMELNCVFNEAGDMVACIDQGGGVSLGGGLDGKYVYWVPQHTGSPLASFTVPVGKGVMPQVGPPYKITVESITNNKLMVSMDATNPVYASGAYETQIDNGSYTAEKDEDSGIVYDYNFTIINAKAGLVRVEIVNSDSPDQPVDMGLAWQSDGQGLLFIQHTTTQTFLDMIQPGQGHVGGNSEGARGPQWHLAAQAPISLSGKVRSMHFLTPSLLLLDTGNIRGPQFSELPFHIIQEQGDSKPSLTLGKLKPLPGAISVTRHGTDHLATVRGWSCKPANGVSN